MAKSFDTTQREQTSLFVSDTHLFHKRNGALDIQGLFIEQTDPDRLYLLGDIIDYEYIQDMLVDQMEIEGIGLQDIPTDFEDVLSMVSFRDMEAHLRFIDIIMAKVDEGVEVHYITGNHDNNLDLLHRMNIMGVQFHDHMIEDFGGVPTHLEHGDENDPACLINYNGLYARCSGILDAGLVTDHKLKSIFDRFAPDDARYPFPITNTLKTLGKFFISTFRENAVRRAVERGAEACVLGHIHKQDIGTMKTVTRIDDGHPDNLPTILVNEEGFTYRNTGDGLTHGTAIMYNGETDEYSDDGWHILTRHSLEPSKTFERGAPNPYEEYRARSLAFLQAGWVTFMRKADLSQGWDHANADAINDIANDDWQDAPPPPNDYSDDEPSPAYG